MAIYGDYDVDGTNSSAMLHLFFKSFDSDVEFYIPDRFSEGYGISMLGIDRLHKKNINLIITIDCGITAVEQIKYAKTLGIDVIICDHHEPGSELPEAVAVLDPIKPNCPYPFKHLSGCGVGYKLVQAICIQLGKKDLENEYLDFVALAAAADIVPLIGENRSLVTHGLMKINNQPRPGLKGLIECAGLTLGKVTTSNVVFGLAPRINAAGRLGDAKRAVELLIEVDSVKAFQRAQELESENRNRRSIDEVTFNDAQEMAEEMMSKKACRSLVLYNPRWHSGVLGIVASRLVERYHLPAVMLTRLDNIIKGSARSIPHFDIHNALKVCESHLLEYGGHKYAAGLSISPDNVDKFKDAFSEYANRAITSEMLIPELNIDTEVLLDELNPKFFNIIKQFAPYGPQNLQPLFVLRNAEIIGYPRITGKDHLKFRVRSNEGFIDAIGFSMGSRLQELQSGSIYDLVCNIEENEFRGIISPQLRIHDFQFAESLVTKNDGWDWAN
ncbi:MAG: single-stranded-DNA-specific exonuclease RecJ [Chlorobi bacterium]|nr:single-stranded-DNA-specific exonuclease RecJ [Chlorobiota bacterium]